MRPREGPENRTIAEIERQGEIINNPVEEADWESDRVLLEGINESFIETMARKWHAAYRKAQNSNLVRQKEKEFLLEEHAKACEMASKNRCLSKQQAARIEQLEAEIERLRADLEQAEICIRARMECIDDQAAHIQELEDALVEERANEMIQSDDCTQNEDAADFHHRCICEYNVKKCPVEKWWLDRARQALQAEGKIGSGDHIAEPNKLIGSGDDA